MSLRSWAVILAGGDGKRLLPLTRLISRDDRPKQFCAIFRGQTLLDQTWARIRPVFDPERTVFSLVEAHEPYYATELAGVAASRMVIQPSNKGTTAAILSSVLRILRSDFDPVIAFFPADHYYSDDAGLIDAVHSAIRAVEQRPASLILLGAEPRYPEIEYGWIERGAPLKTCRGELFHVNRFWEKPARDTAQRLLERGCLWNTFVMIGRARVFLAAILAKLPHLRSVLDRMLARGVDFHDRLPHLYATLAASDFSHQVLADSTDRLSVLRLAGSDWDDLGKPERVLATMAREGTFREAPELVAISRGAS